MKESCVRTAASMAVAVICPLLLNTVSFHHVACLVVQAFQANSTYISPGSYELSEHLQSGWLQSMDKLCGPCQPLPNLQCHAPEVNSPQGHGSPQQQGSLSMANSNIAPYLPAGSGWSAC